MGGKIRVGDCLLLKSYRRKFLVYLVLLKFRGSFWENWVDRRSDCCFLLGCGYSFVILLFFI